MSFQSKFKEFLKKDWTMTLDEELDEDIDSNEEIDYFKRYSKLMKKCEEIKSQNERLINNIYNIKKLSKIFQKHKKILIKRLTKHRVDYKNYVLPLFSESEHSPQNSTNDIKTKNLVIKSNSNSALISSKNKKSKPNNSRNEMNGTSCVAPKKPINPYLLFCQENRSSLQEKYQSKHNSEMTHQELTKALAQQWHELSLTAKQVYYNLFNNEKVRYENQMKLFTANKDSTNESCD